jgi:hypothetical protein
MAPTSSLGGTKPVTGMKGRLYDSNGQELPAGTVVEVYAGDTRCGVTSLRYGDVTEGYVTLTVAGPELIPACKEGAQLTFRLDGKPAKQTAVNDLKSGSDGHELDLILQ